MSAVTRVGGSIGLLSCPALVGPVLAVISRTVDDRSSLPVRAPHSRADGPAGDHSLAFKAAQPDRHPECGMPGHMGRPSLRQNVSGEDRRGGRCSRDCGCCPCLHARLLPDAVRRPRGPSPPTCPDWPDQQTLAMVFIDLRPAIQSNVRWSPHGPRSVATPFWRCRTNITHPCFRSGGMTSSRPSVTTWRTGPITAPCPWSEPAGEGIGPEHPLRGPPAIDTAWRGRVWAGQAPPPQTAGPRSATSALLTRIVPTRSARPRAFLRKTGMGRGRMAKAVSRNRRPPGAIHIGGSPRSSPGVPRRKNGNAPCTIDVQRCRAVVRLQLGHPGPLSHRVRARGVSIGIDPGPLAGLPGGRPRPVCRTRLAGGGLVKRGS